MYTGRWGSRRPCGGGNEQHERDGRECWARRHETLLNSTLVQTLGRCAAGALGERPVRRLNLIYKYAVTICNIYTFNQRDPPGNSAAPAFEEAAYRIK